MKEYYALLREKGECFAAELLINTDRDPIYRYASAHAEYFRHAVLPPYDGADTASTATGKTDMRECASVIPSPFPPQCGVPADCGSVY